MENSLDICHDVLEELHLGGMYCGKVAISCPKLKKSVMCWEGWGGILMPEVLCPIVSDLTINGYENINALPSVLRQLHIIEVERGKEGLVLAHPGIENVSINRVDMKRIVLLMPRFMHIEIGDVKVKRVKVALKEMMTLEPIPNGGEGTTIMLRRGNVVTKVFFRTENILEVAYNENFYSLK